MINLLVTTLSRKRFCLELRQEDTVFTLLELLLQKTGCPIDLQVLKFQNGKIDEVTLSDAKLPISECGLSSTSQPNWACLIRKLPAPPSIALCDLCGLQKLPKQGVKGKEIRPECKLQKLKSIRPSPLPPMPTVPPPALPTSAQKSTAVQPAVSRSASEKQISPRGLVQRTCFDKARQPQVMSNVAPTVAQPKSAPQAVRAPPSPGAAGGYPQSWVAAAPGQKHRAVPDVRGGVAASIVAASPVVRPPATFTKPVQPAPQRATFAAEEPVVAPTCQSVPAPLTSQERLVAGATSVQTPRGRRIRRADLETVGRLGVGAFGLVTLEVDRRTGRTYALKAVSKGYLAQLKMQYSVLNEKSILKLVDSPFVVRLLATYNGREYVYFLLEAALGGELFTTYERLRVYGSEPHAKFYVACVTEALTHLHERNVIYRDLKPENLLLDARGYCKLTDMGLAKVSAGLTYTLVGTPDYMAPEMILRTGHGRCVDWWMLGVLLFELLAGRAPFEAEKTELTYEKVKKGIDCVQFPPACRGLAGDLVRRLCRPKPEERVRVPVLREHSWFHQFDWKSLQSLRMCPPFRPTVKGQRDISNFRQCDQEEPPAVHYEPDGTNWDAGFEEDIMSLKISTL